MIGRVAADLRIPYTWDMARDIATANVNIYRRHNLSQALTAGLPAKLN